MGEGPWIDEEDWRRAERPDLAPNAEAMREAIAWMTQELGLALEPWQRKLLLARFFEDEQGRWRWRDDAGDAGYIEGGVTVVVYDDPPATCTCGRLLLWRLAGTGDETVAVLSGKAIADLVVAPCNCGTVHATELVADERF